MQTRQTTREIVDRTLDLSELSPKQRQCAEDFLTPIILAGETSKRDLARLILREPQFSPLRELPQNKMAKFLRCSAPIVTYALHDLASPENPTLKPGKGGRPKLLSDEAEDRIRQWVIDRCETQDWPTLSAFKARVFSELELANPSITPTSQYFYDLQKRLLRDEYTVKLATGMGQERFDVHPATIQRHFDLLQELRIGEIDPRLIINLDETGFGASPAGRIKTEKVIVPTAFVGTPVFRCNEEKRFISCLAATTAWGSLLSPGLIADRKYDCEDAAKCSFYSRCQRYWSGKAFVSREIFGHYVRSVIIPYVQAIRALKREDDARALIIFDGHKSHLSDELNALCASNCILLYLIPPHSSHLLQPLDQWIFHKMKREFAQTSPIRELSKISSSLERVWCAYQSSEVFWGIWRSWRQAGIEPHIQDGVCVAVGLEPNRVLESPMLCHAQVPSEMSRGRRAEPALYGCLNEDEWLLQDANYCPLCCRPLDEKEHENDQ